MPLSVHTNMHSMLKHSCRFTLAVIETNHTTITKIDHEPAVAFINEPDPFLF